MHVQEEIYHKELVHIMMDDEKSHDLLSTCWRPRKASGIVQFESKGLRTKSVKQAKMGVPIQEIRQEGMNSFSCLLFYLGPNRLADAHQH